MPFSFNAMAGMKNSVISFFLSFQSIIL